MHARGDPTLTLELELGHNILFPLMEERQAAAEEEAEEGARWWVMLSSVQSVGHFGRRARVVLEVMV